MQQLNKPVIVGAGPGGVSTALYLAKQGIPCLLVDQSTFPRDKICGDALSGKVRDTLRKYDPLLISELKNLGQEQTTALPSWGIEFVAPNGKSLRVPFKKNYDASQPSPGYIAQRLDFDYWLLQQAEKQTLIQILLQTKVQDLAPHAEGIRLQTNTGQEYITPLVVGADGAQSVVSKKLHPLNKLERKHYCAGIRAYYHNVGGLLADGFIELHFLPELLPGYLWIFPLPNGRANVGLGIRSDVVQKKRLNLRQMLQDLLQRHPTFKNRFENAVLEGSVMGWGLPLGSKVRRISGDNYLLTGDAASLIDPFTGEGIGNAMIAGRIAAEYIAQHYNITSQLKASLFTSRANKVYDQKVYQRLGAELRLSTWLQRLVNYPFLFNFIVNKANRNSALQETITCMFEDVELRKQFTNPRFYWKLLFE